MNSSISSNTPLIKKLMMLAGWIEIIVGLLHFAMPYFVIQSLGFSQLSETEMDFVALVISAVGILLIAFGSATLLLTHYIESFPSWFITS